MCTSLSKSSPPRKGAALQIQRLNRRRLSKEAKQKRKKMVFNNLKLYLENKNMMEENEKLRVKAALLIKENQALSSQLQNLSSHHHLIHLPPKISI